MRHMATMPHGSPHSRLAEIDASGRIGDVGLVLAGATTRISEAEKCANDFPHVRRGIVVMAGLHYWPTRWRFDSEEQEEFNPLISWTREVYENREKGWDNIDGAMLGRSVYHRDWYCSFFDPTAREGNGGNSRGLRPIDAWWANLVRLARTARFKNAYQVIHIDSGDPIYNPGSHDFTRERHPQIRKAFGRAAEDATEILRGLGYAVTFTGYGPVPAIHNGDSIADGWKCEDFREHQAPPITMAESLSRERSLYGRTVRTGWLTCGKNSILHARPGSHMDRNDAKDHSFLTVNTFLLQAENDDGPTDESPFYEGPYLMMEHLSPGFEDFDLSGFPVAYGRATNARMDGGIWSSPGGNVLGRAGTVGNRQRTFLVDTKNETSGYM